MTNSTNLNIFPDEVEGGTTEFAEGQTFYGLRFTDLKQGRTVTVNFTRQSLTNFASELEALLALARHDGPPD